MPRPKVRDGLFWVTAADSRGVSACTIDGKEGSRVYIRASEDVVIVERQDGTLVCTRIGKVLCTERAVIVRNRMNAVLGRK